MTYQDIADKIEQKGLKKSWVAKQLGISNTLFSFYITGTRPIPESTKEEIEAIIG